MLFLKTIIKDKFFNYLICTRDRRQKIAKKLYKYPMSTWREAVQNTVNALHALAVFFIYALLISIL